MFRHAARAALAVLAPQRLSDHTVNTEILFIELPLLKQFGNSSPLLISAAEFGNISGVLYHRAGIEIRSQAKKDCK